MGKKATVQKNSTESAVLALTKWFKENQRPLPWRSTKDPYSIWISEVMLQQTTVKAVIPYYERFLKRFPTVDALASASIEEVYTLWSGLGYYSRARNLHKAAQEIHRLKKFPDNHKDLLELPGFGDYTSRAVASIAFEEPAGVVDGNVIRVMSRVYNQAWLWWNNNVRKEIQAVADEWARKETPSVVNQSLMELGATICTPQKPSCFLCPIRKNCLAYQAGTVEKLPVQRARKAREVWIWDVDLVENKKRFLLSDSHDLPFLKSSWVFPGTIKKSKTKPKDFHVRHSITHHDIFVRIHPKKRRPGPKEEWLDQKQVIERGPASLLQKILAALPSLG